MSLFSTDGIVPGRPSLGFLVDAIFLMVLVTTWRPILGIAAVARQG